MVEFKSPKVTILELPSLAGTTPIESTSIPIFHTTATRGPVNRPVTVTSPADYDAVFGEDDGGYGFQSADGFFINGGRRLVVNRIAGYTDISDAGTLTAVSAETTVDTPNPSATVATKSTTQAGPFNLHPAELDPGTITSPYELTVQVDGAGADTWTYVPTPGIYLAAGAPGGIGTATDTIDFDVTTPSGTVTHVYEVPGSPPTTASDWAASLTAQIPGVAFVVVAGAVQAETDGYGTGYNVGVSASTGTALVDSGFTVGAGTAGGPIGISDVSVIASSELAALLEAAWTGGGTTDVVANADETLTASTVATGGAASLSAVTGSLATLITFTPAGVVTGTGAGGAGVPTLKFLASSPGVHGNTLSVSTTRTDRILGNLSADLAGGGPFTGADVTSVDGIRTGIQVFFEDTVTSATLRAVVAKVVGLSLVFENPASSIGGDLLAVNSPTMSKETFTVTPIIDGAPATPQVDLSMSALDVKFFVGNVIGSDPDAIDPRQRMLVELQGAPLSATEDPRPIDTVNQLFLGGTNGTAPVDTDYVGNQASGLGIWASERSDIFSMMAIPGIETVAVHRAMMDFANLKKRHVALVNPPPGMTDVIDRDYFTVDAALFGTYTIAYAGELTILRSSSGAQESFPTSGYMCGVYARNDNLRNVSTPPMGVRNGLIAGAIGVANGNYYAGESRRDTLYPDPGINTVYLKEGRGIIALGQLTLDPTSDRGAIGVRRAMISLERDIESLSDFVLGELNTTVLRESYKTKVTGYLRQRWKDGVLQGDNERQAFNIVCDKTNNPPSVVNARQFYADILVNVIPGIDYVVIRIQRDDRSLQEELAAAA